MANNMEIFEQWESKIRAYCRAVPTVFTSSSNATMQDENGKSYLDFFAGAGVLNFGHNNAAMKRAVIDFIEKDGVTHSLDMYTSVKRDFIETFVETILKPRGMNHKMQFTGPTGTNAVEASLKLARRITGRENIVAFTKGFHGMTLGALTCTANQYFRNAAGVRLDYVIRQPFGCESPCKGCSLGCGMESLNALRATFEDPASGVKAPAAFLVETIQAEGGVRVASREWLHGVQQLAKDLGALFIIDDIQVGSGRTGNYFSFDGMELDPDIVVLAKGIGGFGTPLAMTLNKPEWDEHWSPGEHTGTFRGQGISFVAGKVGIEYFKDEVFGKDVKTKGVFMQQTLLRVVAKHPELQLRGKGMIWGMDFGVGEPVKAIATACFQNGLIIGACSGKGEVLKFIPPLTIPQEELERGLKIFENACDKILGATQ